MSVMLQWPGQALLSAVDQLLEPALAPLRPGMLLALTDPAAAGAALPLRCAFAVSP